MALSSQHPHYVSILPLWKKLLLAYEGQSAVKRAGVAYLPATSGMLHNGMASPEQLGYKMYAAYIERALFPDYVKEGVEAMIGAMHSSPPVIELPEKMRTIISSRNEVLPLLLRRINEAQLVTGRIGLFVDLPREAPITVLPYIATYAARSIINWDSGSMESNEFEELHLVVLDETGAQRVDGFNWEETERYRVLTLGDIQLFDEGFYQQGLFTETSEFDPSRLMTPTYGAAALEKIPFTFINATDLLPDPCSPPLLGLAEICYAIYRGDADYRQSLFMQGQDTLLLKTDKAEEDDPIVYGAGAVIRVPTDGGDGKFIGVSGSGLVEQREALRDLHKMANERSGRLQDTKSNDQSGKALNVRVAAQTVTLNQIALTGAAGLQDALRNIALWIGANPDEVIVRPNMDFIEGGLSPADFVALQAAKQNGLPLSDESVHARLRESKLTEEEYADEVAKLVEERGRIIEPQ